MKFYDLHCDTLTACADKGLSLFDGGLQTDFQKLRKSGGALQCFAVFTQGETASSDFRRYLGFYKEELKARGGEVLPVFSFADILRAEKEDKLACVLTVENLGFLGGHLDGLSDLKREGVQMASLVWNYKNAFAEPNLVFENDYPRFEKRNPAGLTRAGKEAVERLNALKIIIDISHLSDGGAEYILENAALPVVASHSNAWEVCKVSRNLTDSQIKKIADCGGVAGINYCRDFLGGEPFESVYRHIKYMIDVGGEEVVALGSDFDGIPAYDEICGCEKLQSLFAYLIGRGISPRQMEKICVGNARRVFKEI